MSDEEKPNVFQRNRARRDARVTPLGDVSITPETKQLIIELVSEGAMITELCDRGVIPAYHYLWREMRRDAEFAASYKQAQTDGARVLLHAAEAHAIDAINTNDPDMARAADALMRITETYAEKMAPKEFGQLVKLAGDADQPLILNVVNFAAQSGARPLDAIDADYTETRAIDTQRETTRAYDEADDGAATSGESVGAEVAQRHTPRTD